MHPHQGRVIELEIAHHEHAVDRHAGRQHGKKLLCALFAQFARQRFDLGELCAAYGRVPLDREIELVDLDR